VCGHGHLGPKLLIQYVFTGDTTISQSASTDLSTLLGWTDAVGVKYEPKSGTLLLWGTDGSSNPIVARVDQNNAFSVLVSTNDTTVNDADIPQNIGPDGCYVSRTTANSFAKIDASTLTAIYSSSLVGSPWNIAASAL